MLTYAGVAVVKPEIILGPWQASETSIVHVLGIRNYGTRSNTWYVGTSREGFLSRQLFLKKDCFKRGSRN